MRLQVIIPTIGRAELTCKAVSRLWNQTRLPDGVIVAGVTAADVAGIEAAAPRTEIVFAPKGLCSQRNHALNLIRDKAELVIFFDDDFVPADDYLAKVEELFEQNPDIVGACGRIVADGVRGAGFSFEEAVSLVDQDAQSAEPPGASREIEALYGCNMAFRTSALDGVSFDENLPLYGWLEDIDFSYHIGRRGRLIKAASFAGVHMGSKAARSPGRRLGYSQIANPVYLLRKGGIPSSLAWRLMTQQFASNVLRTLRPQEMVDHRGRFIGNLKALGDLALGRIDPRRILEFQ
jgi:GT2 family glycosyltransferase